MAYEVMTAFFLEAGFLGVMLFGIKKVGKRAPFFCHLHGGGWDSAFGNVDHQRQQLDADARRFCGK